MHVRVEKAGSLSNYKVSPGAEVAFFKVDASVAVSDMSHAEEFYEGRLGLSVLDARPDGSRIYACGGGTSLRVHLSPDLAGKSTATLATWYVTDLEQVVDELTSSGVRFEHYPQSPLKSDEKGIHVLEDGKVAWFKDPDGNTFAVEQ